MTTTDQHLRIALLAPVVTPVPPPAYAGTERVVAALAQHLHERGHKVTLYASGDSHVPGRLVPIVERSLWASGYQGDGRQYAPIVADAAWRDADEYDVIHSHLEAGGFLLARHCRTPVVSTLHNRLDTEGMPDLLEHFSDIPVVAISDSQKRWSPGANWVATIHHGLARGESLASERPGEYLVVVGRLTWEKGIEEAIEVARSTGLPLKIAGKAHEDIELEMLERVVKPAVEEGVAEYVGELAPNERDALLAGALACLMLGAWPEPFGLVAIESMVTGTPVIARRAGGLTETVQHGTTGFLVDDMMEARTAVERAETLDRVAIRTYALERFSPDRMVEQYETVYRQLAR